MSNTYHTVEKNMGLGSVNDKSCDTKTCQYLAKDDFHPDSFNYPGSSERETFPNLQVLIHKIHVALYCPMMTRLSGQHPLILHST